MSTGFDQLHIYVSVCESMKYLFLSAALRLKAQRQLAERRYGNRVGDFGDLAVAIG